MSNSQTLPRRLSDLVIKWDGFCADPSELQRVGVRPKSGNLRGLESLLVKHGDSDLEAVVSICEQRRAEAQTPDTRDFWAYREAAVQLAMQDRKSIQDREVRRGQRGVRRNYHRARPQTAPEPDTVLLGDLKSSWAQRALYSSKNPNTPIDCDRVEELFQVSMADLDVLLEFCKRGGPTRRSRKSREFWGQCEKTVQDVKAARRRGIKDYADFAAATSMKLDERTLRTLQGGRSGKEVYGFSKPVQGGAPGLGKR